MSDVWIIEEKPQIQRIELEAKVQSVVNQVKNRYKDPDKLKAIHNRNGSFAAVVHMERTDFQQLEDMSKIADLTVGKKLTLAMPEFAKSFYLKRKDRFCFCVQFNNGVTANKFLNTFKANFIEDQTWIAYIRDEDCLKVIYLVTENCLDITPDDICKHLYFLYSSEKPLKVTEVYGSLRERFIDRNTDQNSRVFKICYSFDTDFKRKKNVVLFGKSYEKVTLNFMSNTPVFKESSA